MKERRILMGVPFRVATRDEAVANIDHIIATAGRTKIAFANAHTLNVARKNPEFLSALQNFCVFNDGVGVDIASRLKFGKPFPHNLNGTDFVPHYLERCTGNLRVFFFGGRPGTAEVAASAMIPPGSRHEIAGCHHGFVRGREVDRVCHAIRASKPDIVLVALGNPAQELWIERYAAAAGSQVYMGVGALFDFMSGTVKRAPKWVRAARSEWMYRLMREPLRLGVRYTWGNLEFLYHCLRECQAEAPRAATRASGAPSSPIE